MSGTMVLSRTGTTDPIDIDRMFGGDGGGHHRVDTDAFAAIVNGNEWTIPAGLTGPQTTDDPTTAPATAAYTWKRGLSATYTWAHKGIGWIVRKVGIYFGWEVG